MQPTQRRPSPAALVVGVVLWTLAFVVEVDTDTFITSPKYGLTEPTIEFTFDGCEAGQPSTNCPRVAGVGTVEVRAVGPVGLTDTTTLQVENQIVGGPLEAATTVNFVNQGDHRLARTFVSVDDAPGQDWVISARVGDQPDSRTYALVASDITVTVPQCPANEDECSFPAGLGSVVVDITAPANTAAAQATLVSSIDGVTINTETVALSGTANNPKTGSKMLAVPDQLGRWLLEARVGASFGQRESIELRPATDITLVLGDRNLSDEELCSGAVEPPPRAVLEPTAACRELALCVLAPDRPANGQIAITTNIGQVGGQSGQATVTIDDTGQAVLDVDLPTSVPSDPRLIVEGSADGVGGVPLVYALAPVLPIGPGTLNSPVNVATVGETGSSSITLSGQLPLPQGASLASDARLTVRVEAEPAVAPVGLPCGPSISDAALDCDPSQGNPGGCVLAPLEVPVSADGSYSIPLAGGICFEGTVTVSALGLVYDDNSATCLGERPAQTDESIVGQASPLTYQP